MEATEDDIDMSYSAVNEIKLFDILYEIGFQEHAEYDKSFIDKILLRTASIRTVYLKRQGLKINMETLEWFNNGKSLGVVFDYFIEHEHNVISYVIQTLRENKLNRIDNED